MRKRVHFAFLAFFLVLAVLALASVGKYLPVLWGLAFKNDVLHLKETPDNRVNILLLGVGGGAHDGPDLTDTIIFASIDPQAKKITLVSLPRDLWVPDLRAKVNTVYTLAEDKDKATALDVTKATIAKMLGQEIDYAVKIDFNGFVQIVNTVGGLTVNVDTTFDDYEYPIAGKEADSCGLSDTDVASRLSQIASGTIDIVQAFPCRYEHLHFDKGVRTLDGVTALKYVRSRHGSNGEGSDFARSKRQEKVITAFKEKLFSVDTLLNPVKVVSIVHTLQGSIETNIKESEYSDFVKLAEDVKGGKVTSAIIDTGDTSEDRYGILINPPIGPAYDNEWVLSPRVGGGDYTELQEYVSCFITNPNCYVGKTGILTPTPTPVPSSSPEKKQ